ncbi:hypothetical protein HEAFMP_HEAFMP_04115, partial [Dysosmobacter welbionis]
SPRRRRSPTHPVSDRDRSCGLLSLLVFLSLFPGGHFVEGALQHGPAHG